MERRRKSSYVRSARLEAMFNMLGNGSKSSEDLKIAAQKAEEALASRIGDKSEKIFDHKIYSHFAWLIESLIPATPFEDHNKVDRWIVLKENDFFPRLAKKILPVQLKSHQPDVDAFRETLEYRQNFRKKILVLCVNPNTSKSDFKTQMFSELNRISLIFESEQI